VHKIYKLELLTVASIEVLILKIDLERKCIAV